MSTFKDASKTNWESIGSVEHINSGSLQRIADATEAMAKNYIQLQYDKDKFQRWYNDELEEKERAFRTIITLRGHITRLKNKLKNA